MRSEREILADIRKLRHLLDKQRLTRTTAALKAAEQEIKALKARLEQPPPAAPPSNGK